VHGERAAGPIVVIGLGNVFRSDDAAGLLVARAVRERAPAGVRVVEREGEPVELLDLWGGAALAVVVDAVESGGIPGQIIRLESRVEPIPASFRHRGTHTLGLIDAIELGGALGRLPDRLVVYGIEGARFDSGEQCSPVVLTAVDATVERVLGEVADVPR
jgi:hydrogenase maturation protease